MKEEAPREKCLFFLCLSVGRIQIFFRLFLFCLQIVTRFRLLMRFGLKQDSAYKLPHLIFILQRKKFFCRRKNDVYTAAKP